MIMFVKIIFVLFQLMKVFLQQKSELRYMDIVSKRFCFKLTPLHTLFVQINSSKI